MQETELTLIKRHPKENEYPGHRVGENAKEHLSRVCKQLGKFNTKHTETMVKYLNRHFTKEYTWVGNGREKEWSK